MFLSVINIFIYYKIIMFKYNKDAKYEVGGYGPKTISFSELDVAVTETASFQAKCPNPLGSYLNPPIKTYAVAKAWMSNPMQFYQNHLNFAIHCATAGCGVSYADHMNHPNLLVKSLYRFHVYYQFRRVLSELQVPMATDNNFNPFNSRVNMKAYERLCDEFGIDYKTDFRQKLDGNHGMGILSYWGVHAPYTSFFFGKAVFPGPIKQKHKDAWTTFFLDKSEGFTRPGLERINESVRVYVWCLLGAQAQTRSSIMDTGFDAQKQYLSNLEDSISSAVDLPSSIKRYQDVLRYARSKVDFAIGHGLYMLPSNLQLQIGTITNYNNEILIAGDDQQLGKNERINNKPADVIVRTTHPVPVTPHKKEQTEQVIPPVTPHKKEQTEQVIPPDNHTNEMIALSFFLVTGGLVYLYFRK